MGSHGRLLMKKNCLSVALLPTPWSPRDTNPVILPKQSVSFTKVLFCLQRRIKQDFHEMVKLTKRAVWVDLLLSGHILQEHFLWRTPAEKAEDSAAAEGTTDAEIKYLPNQIRYIFFYTVPLRSWEIL